jgi:hypothetical protein
VYNHSHHRSFGSVAGPKGEPMPSFADFPQHQNGLLLSFVSFYRELHDRAEGKQCMCGVCRMVRQFADEMKLPLTVHPENLGPGKMEDAMRCLELAKKGS